MNANDLNWKLVTLYVAAMLTFGILIGLGKLAISNDALMALFLGAFAPSPLRPGATKPPSGGAS